MAQQATLANWEATLAGDNGPQPDDTFVGNPWRADSFYVFRDGIAHEMPCPAGFIFNPTVSTCDWPMNVSQDVNPAPR